VSTYRNAGLFVLLSFLWGSSFMAIKAGLEFLPPVLFAAIRYDIAGGLLLVYAAATSDYWLPRTRADWTVVAVGAVFIIGLYNAFLFVGQQGVTSGVAAILVAMNPVLATGFSRLLLPSERLGLLETVGLGAGLLGVGLVARPATAGVVTADLLAPGLVLLAASAVALGSVLVQRIESELPTVGMVGWSTVFGALALHALSGGLPSESLSDAAFTTETVLIVGYLAVFASAVGYVIYFDLLKQLGAIEINLVSYTVPVFAAISGWVVLGESLDWLSVVGFLAIFGGFILVKHEALGERLAQ